MAERFDAKLAELADDELADDYAARGAGIPITPTLGN
jgi:hypothetical protein